MLNNRLGRGQLEDIKLEIRNLFASKYIEEVPSKMNCTIWADLYLSFQKNGFEFLVELTSVNTMMGYEIALYINYPERAWNIKLNYPDLLDRNSPSFFKVFNLVAFLDAVTNPKLWPLCIHIPWAQVIVSHMLAL
jgi:hypothetical protein